MALLSLHIFCEKTLRWIAFGDEPPTKPKDKSKSNITHYIDIISSGYQTAIPEEVHEMLGKSNKLRNHFAHGSWDKIQEEVNNVDLREYFRSLARLLHQIEDFDEKQRNNSKKDV